VFEKLYRALVRFVLVLGHDFPAFLSQVAIEVVAYLPSGFWQLRNIILSVHVGPQPIPVTEARRNLAQVPGIDTVFELQMPFRYLAERLAFADSIKNISAFGDLVDQLKAQTGENALTAFVVFLTNSIIRSLPMPHILGSIETTHLYFLLSSLIEKFEHDSILVLINALLDQLRQPSKGTLVYFQVLLALFRNDLKSEKMMEPISVAEMLLRAVMERAATPPPHPWGIMLLVVELLENRSHGLWEMPCVVRSKAVERFLRSAGQAFGAALA
jgi:CCR4-NOT transcription complex subunit 1